MPIRFRCAYCNQLMGIARRKAGNVVRCPACAGQVIVPTPGAEALAPAPPPPSNPPRPHGGAALLEHGDFDKDVLKQPAVPKGARRNGPSGSASLPTAPSVRDQAIDVEPVSMPLAMGREAQDTGFQLSVGAAFGLGIVVLLLMGLAFFAGLVLGRSAGA